MAILMLARRSVILKSAEIMLGLDKRLRNEAVEGQRVKIKGARSSLLKGNALSYTARDLDRWRPLNS